MRRTISRKMDPVKQVIKNVLYVTCCAGKTSSEDGLDWDLYLVQPEQLENPHLLSRTENTEIAGRQCKDC